MKALSQLILGALLVQPFLALGQDAKAEVKSAAKKLADQPNYSWTATDRSEGDGTNWRIGPTEGKTEKGGWLYLTSSFNDTSYEVALKGSRGAIKRDGDWETDQELEAGDSAWIAQRLRAFQAPAEEAADLAEKTSELKKGPDGVFSGTLTPEGVKELLSRGRRSNQEVKGAKGTVKFWLKDGVLTKYEYNRQGTITTGDGREIEVNRTATVEIKDVGATKVSVPEEAKKKLS